MVGLRIESLSDRFGNHVKKDTLFNNLYDYWTRFHDSNKRYFWWYPQLLWKIEMSISRKSSKYLPKLNIIFKKYEEKDQIFDPRRFLGEFDWEKYFELLKG